MKEIGGYIELESYTLPMLHKDAIKLNCARNCLDYLIRLKGIKKILLPKFLCNSIREICQRENVNIRYYSINWDFLPGELTSYQEEWLYLVNYYGQISNSQIEKLAQRYDKIIVDNVQAYYQEPVKGIDTFYTCRKFFGVPDGAFLYTNGKAMPESFLNNLPIDESFERLHHLLGRFERTASEYYKEYVTGEKEFKVFPIRQMSRLTNNFLHAIDYDSIKWIRTENFRLLHSAFKDINKLKLFVPEGAFMYPLWIENGETIRKRLQSKKIYIPMLWPDTLEICKEDDLEVDMSKNILPLPVDQRYQAEDMKFIIEEVKRCIN